VDKKITTINESISESINEVFNAYFNKKARDLRKLEKNNKHKPKTGKLER